MKTANLTEEQRAQLRAAFAEERWLITGIQADGNIISYNCNNRHNALYCISQAKRQNAAAIYAQRDRQTGPQRWESISSIWRRGKGWETPTQY